MEKLLARQMKRAFALRSPDDFDALLAEARASLAGDGVPEPARRLVEGLPALLDLVDRAYVQSDRDLTLRARSLEISSTELNEANDRLREDARRQQALLDALVSTANRLLEATGGETIGADDLSPESLCDLLVRLSDQLTASRQRAEAANVAKTEFLANMSHEIRTPMNGVVGMTELLTNTSLDGRQKIYVQRVQQSATMLLGIINEILDFSRVESGKLQFESVDFDLRAVTEEAIELLAEQAQKKGLEMLCEIPERMWTSVVGDPQRIKQVLINLVGNAIKFTEHGEIAVRVSHFPAPDGQIGVCFEVRDTGIGMTKDACERIFSAFVQADGSMVRKHGGTGLGLAISKRLAQLMGGDISVESTPGEGSTFWFTARVDVRDPSGTYDIRPRACLRGTRALIVDDNATNRCILDEHLTAWGVETIQADDGPSALAVLEDANALERPFDLVLIDRHMPALDGISTIEQARDLLGEARVLMLSSVGADDASRVANRINAYLVKPVRRDALKHCIERLLGEIVSTGEIERLKPKEGIPPGLRVLVVEDNPVNQEVALGMLELLDAVVTTAGDGREAVERFTGAPFDIVFMDCQMPVLDGYEATKRIRALEKSRRAARTPIVALTANSFPEDVERCYAAGMDDFVRKPFSFDALQSAIERAAPSGAPRPIAPPEPAALEREVPASSRLDDKALAALAALRRPGKPDIARRVIDSFIVSTPSLLDRMMSDLSNGDRESVRRAAHSIKSTSGTLGARQLEAEARHIERVAPELDVEDLRSLVANLEEEARHVCAELASLELA